MKCKHCGEQIHKVPAGDGTAWVNPWGYRACLGANEPQQHEPEFTDAELDSLIALEHETRPREEVDDDRDFEAEAEAEAIHRDGGYGAAREAMGVDGW